VFNILEFAAKEKSEIVIGAAHFDFAQYKPPPFRIFAGGIFRKNAFGLIQEYCTTKADAEASQRGALHRNTKSGDHSPLFAC